MENNTNVSLPTDAPEWPIMSNWKPSNSTERSCTPSPSPASPLAPGLLSAPLLSSPHQNQRAQQIYFNLSEPLPQNCMDNYIIPPSAMMLPEMTVRRPEMFRAATDEPKKRIPRPPNAFMLFRSWLLKHGKVPPNVERRQQNLSRIAGRCWNMLNDDEKKVWRDQAANVLQAHQRKFPAYKFTPAPKGTGRGGKLKRAAEDLGEEVVDDVTRIQLLAEMCCPELKGRGITPSRKRPTPKVKRQEFVEDVDFRAILSRSFTPSHSGSPATSSMSSPASYASSPISISSTPAPSAGSPTGPSPSSASPPFLLPPYLYSEPAYRFAPSPVGTRPSSLNTSGEFEMPSASSFSNDETPTTANFQMSYGPATIYAPTPGAYSFEAPPLPFPSPPYLGVGAFLGLHHLQLPYTNGYPYQHLSASPLGSNDGNFEAEDGLMGNFSFDDLLPTTDYDAGANDAQDGNVNEDSKHSVSKVKSSSPSASRSRTPASQ